MFSAVPSFCFAHTNVKYPNCNIISTGEPVVQGNSRQSEAVVPWDLIREMSEMVVWGDNEDNDTDRLYTLHYQVMRRGESDVRSVDIKLWLSHDGDLSATLQQETPVL